MKLNLGCGEKLRRGYVNVDCQKFQGVDVVANCINIGLRFEPNSVDEIFSAHFLEHHWLTDLKNLFAGCYKILKPGGKMVHEGPDAVKMAHALVAGIIDEDFFLLHLYGSEEHRLKWGIHWMHHIPLSGRFLTRLLEEAGFVDIKVSDGRDHRHPERDFRIEATKPR